VTPYLCSLRDTHQCHRTIEGFPSLEPTLEKPCTSPVSWRRRESNPRPRYPLPTRRREAYAGRACNAVVPGACDT
jgi:hypothetical protein